MMLDTSGLLALIDQREDRHQEARHHYHATARWVTHSYVLAEFIPLCLTRGVARAAALSFCIKLLDNPAMTIVWVDAVLNRVALTLL
jgi:predicted nucleic acid-binding protein